MPNDERLQLIRCRDVIDAIDTELLALLSKRVRVARAAAAIKQSLGLPLQSLEREQEVLARIGHERAEISVEARARIFRLVIDETLASERSVIAPTSGDASDARV
jgi:isochorismate pyruvate lyase